MARTPLQQIVERLRSEPSRTGSLIMTFYGDAVVPRGGTVWLGTLLKFFDLLSIDAGAVRTAASRLVADGWLNRDKIGRKSFYRLADASRARFETGIQHVYSAEPVNLEGGLELLLVPDGADRDTSRTAFANAGFGSPMPGVWVAPSGAPVPSAARGYIRLDVSAANEMGRRLIRDSWPLSTISASYQDFITTFQPLGEDLARGSDLTPSEAILARVLLIHQYRRVLLRDPLLPAELLPAPWPAGDARDLCRMIYRRLVSPSERWMDENGSAPDGAMAPAGRRLEKRFRPDHVTEKT